MDAGHEWARYGTEVADIAREQADLEARVNRLRARAERLKRWKASLQAADPEAWRPPHPTLPVGEAAIAFMQAHRGVWKGAEWTVADRWLTRFTRTVGWDMPLDEVGEVAVRACLGGPGVTESVATRNLELLTSFFGWAVERGYVGTSPVPAPAAGWQREGDHHPTVGRRAFEEARERKIAALEHARQTGDRVVRLDDRRRPKEGETR
jgi:hypothetical protein